MTTLGEVLDRLRALAEELPTDWLAEHAQRLTDEITPALRHLLEGSTRPEPEEILALLATAAEDLAVAAAHLRQTTNHVHAYLAEQTDPLTGARPLDGAPAPVSRLTDLVISASGELGRVARGSKKFPVREVRSVAALNAIFRRFAQGGVDVTPESYRQKGGRLVELPDGTTIGYRHASSTSPHPTVDIRVPGKQHMKIHVNEDGWIDR